MYRGDEASRAELIFVDIGCLRLGENLQQTHCRQNKCIVLFVNVIHVHYKVQTLYQRTATYFILAPTLLCNLLVMEKAKIETLADPYAYTVHPHLHPFLQHNRFVQFSPEVTGSEASSGGEYW